MSTQENVRVMLEIFRSIESRNDERIRALADPDVEFHWPPSLPYGGTMRGLDGNGPSWSRTWVPLQPTDVERSLSPRVVAAQGDEVVVLWRQRGRSSAGLRVDSEVLGLYHLRSGKLARAQMFYFDLAGVVGFLKEASERG